MLAGVIMSAHGGRARRWAADKLGLARRSLPRGSCVGRRGPSVRSIHASLHMALAVSLPTWELSKLGVCRGLAAPPGVWGCGGLLAGPQEEGRAGGRDDGGHCEPPAPISGHSVLHSPGSISCCLALWHRPSSAMPWAGPEPFAPICTQGDNQLAWGSPALSPHVWKRLSQVTVAWAALPPGIPQLKATLA